MELITQEIRERLLANGAPGAETDHYPVVKLFNPTGAATWLITEMAPDGSLFGLADLGLGHPELGYIDLAELQSVKGRFGLGIERDLYFVARFPLSVYAEAARRNGGITESGEILTDVAGKLGLAVTPGDDAPAPPAADR
jgi:hypothetical protein